MLVGQGGHDSSTMRPGALATSVSVRSGSAPSGSRRPEEHNLNYNHNARSGRFSLLQTSQTPKQGEQKKTEKQKSRKATEIEQAIELCNITTSPHHHITTPHTTHHTPHTTHHSTTHHTPHTTRVRLGRSLLFCYFPGPSPFLFFILLAVVCINMQSRMKTNRTLASTVSARQDIHLSVNTLGDDVLQYSTPTITLRAEARMAAILSVHYHSPGQTAPSGVLA